jgi:hypothetical protein
MCADVSRLLPVAGTTAMGKLTSARPFVVEHATSEGKLTLACPFVVEHATSEGQLTSACLLVLRHLLQTATPIKIQITQDYIRKIPKLTYGHDSLDFITDSTS